jgi:hypothetical protein
VRERHVAELLDEVFRRGGLKRGVRRAEAVLLWRRLVGPELAAFSAAKVLRDGVLYVNVSDSETAMHLSMERLKFLSAYRDRYGVKDVREIRFQVGRLRDEEEAVQGASKLPAPDPVELRRLTASLEELALPQDLQRVAVEAGRGLLALQAARRELGWAACPTCGALHDGAVRSDTQREAALREAGRADQEVELGRVLCQACARYAREGRVRDAARRLRTAPLSTFDSLSEEEHAVARFLAGRDLDSTLASLLAATVADPRLARQLAGAARVRLALAHGRPPGSFTAEDLRNLDPRIANVLSLAGEDE